MSEATPSTDHVLRAMTDDGSFRVIVADTTETVRAVIAAQGVARHSMIEAAGIITSSILVRETMAPANRVQVILEDSAGSQLVGDAFPEGKTRGLARIADDVIGVNIDPGAVFRVERIIRSGQRHVGVIGPDDGEGLIATLRKYFLQSEQVVSMVDLACDERDGKILSAAGYVVQLLPELTDPPLVAMRERIERFGTLKSYILKNGVHPESILSTLLEGEAFTQLDDAPLMFHCPCDRERVRIAATALGQEDLKDLVAKNETLDVTCDYCQEVYKLDVEDFRIILATQDVPPTGGDA